jgi:hypothetical protein
MDSPPRSLPVPYLLGKHSDLVEQLVMNELFLSSTSFREQFYHACRVLHHGRQPPVLFEMIARSFAVDRGTIRNHSKKYQSALNLRGTPGRPPILTPTEIDDIIGIIFHYFRERRLLTLREARSIVARKFNRPISSDTLRHILTTTL